MADVEFRTMDAQESHGDEFTEIKRRDFIAGAASVGALLGASGMISAPAIVRAETIKQGPIKFGLIEDYSGIAAYQGLPKLHTTQLAIEEINQGLTLKAGPSGPGGVGLLAEVAKKPPAEKIKQGITNDGGSRKDEHLVFVEDDDILVPSGEKG